MDLPLTFSGSGGLYHQLGFSVSQFHQGKYEEEAAPKGKGKGKSKGKSKSK